MIQVMIVATHIEVREGLGALLRLAEDVEITCADSLTSAEQTARASGLDAIIIDLEMARGEGWGALRGLKQRFPSARVIALTARDYPAARASALQAGADAVLVKGAAVAEIVKTITGS